MIDRTFYHSKLNHSKFNFLGGLVITPTTSASKKIKKDCHPEFIEGNLF